MALAELKFDGASEGAGFSVRRFDVAEGLDMPFDVSLHVTSSNGDVDFEPLMGAAATFTLDRGALGKRTFAGVCVSIEQLPGGNAGDLAEYVVRIAPKLSLLAHRRGHRVFQHLSTPDIAKSLLGEWGIEPVMRLDEAAFPKQELRTQYGESDLDFLSRLLESAGITYFFEDKDGPSKLVLADHPERAERRSSGPLAYDARPAAASLTPFITDLRLGYQTRPGAVTLTDYDFRKPRYQPTHRAVRAVEGEDKLEHRLFSPGASLIEVAADPRQTNETPIADALGRSRHDQEHGNTSADRALGSIRGDRRQTHFSTNVLDLSPGAAFGVGRSPRREISGETKLVVARSSIEGSNDGDWQISGSALFADAPILPVQKTPSPRIEGVQSALVTGPEGEEIHTDEFGRVRVRFHWDREGQDDPNRSPWVRVDAGWAGKGYGFTTLPRVGQEVLVSFYEGNPEQPVIIGRLYNVSAPSPFPLPAGTSKAAIRTRSYPSTDGGYHEIALDDTAGNEVMSLRSERDLEKRVKHDEVETIGEDRSTTIGRHLGTQVTGDDKTTVGDTHMIAIAGQNGAAPSGTRREITGKRITLSSGGATVVLDGPDITITANKGLSFNAGGTVSIQGAPYVHLNPPGSGNEDDDGQPQLQNLVWFQLTSDGDQPLGGARVHLVSDDGTASAPQLTDGNGYVRLPVEKTGSYQIKMGNPPTETPAATPRSETVKTAAATPAATPAPKAAAPAAKPAEQPVTRSITAGKTPAQPTSNAKPTQHKVPITIEIVHPTKDTKLQVSCGDATTTDPAMPKVPLQAKVTINGEPATVGQIKWELNLSGKYRVRSGSSFRQQDFKYAAGTITAKPDEQKELEVAPPEICGGDLEVVATFEGGAELANITATKRVSLVHITGENTPRSVMEAFIAAHAGTRAWLYLRMFCHESDHTLCQFAKSKSGGNTVGDPLYGFPSGVGVVQRDPEATEWHWPKNHITMPNNFFPRIFWDWKKNVVEGISSFESTYIARGRADLEALKKKHPNLPQYSDGVLLRASIRRYNGGSEYGASADGKHYVVAPISSNPGYVNDVLGDPHTSATTYPIPEDATATTWPIPAKGH